MFSASFQFFELEMSWFFIIEDNNQILKPTVENLEFCSEVLHNGGLVAFPTGIFLLQ